MTENSTQHHKLKGDVSDATITLKVRHLWTVVLTIVGITLALGTGWFDLKAEAAEAKRGVESLTSRVARIECLIEQQNNHSIYGIKPTHACL